MHKHGKVWGNTQEIFCLNNVSVNRLEISRGGQCSTHKHEHKYNMFFVEKGSLQVEVWQEDYDLVDTIVLRQGESASVKPGLNHRFTALEETVAYEIYHVSLTSDDIIRKDVGKVIDPI